MNSELAKLIVDVWNAENDYANGELTSIDFENYFFYSYGFGKEEIVRFAEIFQLPINKSYVEDRDDCFSFYVTKKDIMTIKNRI